MSDNGTIISIGETVASVASLPETVTSMASSYARRPLRPIQGENIVLRPAGQRLQRGNVVENVEAEQPPIPIRLEIQPLGFGAVDIREHQFVRPNNPFNACVNDRFIYRRDYGVAPPGNRELVLLEQRVQAGIVEWWCYITDDHYAGALIGANGCIREEFVNQIDEITFMSMDRHRGIVAEIDGQMVKPDSVYLLKVKARVEFAKKERFALKLSKAINLCYKNRPRFALKTREADVLSDREKQNKSVICAMEHIRNVWRAAESAVMN